MIHISSSAHNIHHCSVTVILLCSNPQCLYSNDVPRLLLTHKYIYHHDGSGAVLACFGRPGNEAITALWLGTWKLYKNYGWWHGPPNHNNQWWSLLHVSPTGVLALCLPHPPPVDVTNLVIMIVCCMTTHYHNNKTCVENNCYWHLSAP